MFNTVKLNFYISTKRSNKLGFAPIYYRVTVNAESPIERSTGIYILPAHWDYSKKEVKSACELYSEYNAVLTTIKSKAILKAVKADDEEERLTGDDFKRDRRPVKKVPTILEAAIEWNSLLAKEGNGHKISTETSFTKRLRKLEKFLKEIGLLRAKVTFATVQLAADYKKWLLNSGHSSEYSKKCLHILKHAEKQGVSDGHLLAKNMDIVTFRHKKPKKVDYLEPEEIEVLEYLAEAPGFRILARRFLLQCLTGYAFTDVMAINREWEAVFRGMRCLVKDRDKTDETSIVPLFLKTEEILEEWGWQVPKISNSDYNAELKVLAKAAGITINLTTHIGRHTFGMIMLNNGYSIEVVSKMLGHKSIRITERIYARILPKRIVDETLALKMPVAMAA